MTDAVEIAACLRDAGVDVSPRVAVHGAAAACRSEALIWKVLA
jgi:hypothetical protein